jgi:hypothetical protein
MAKPLQTSVPQFCDANGNPYAGGTLETYIPGTTTPKDTWADHGATALNSNPIVLDAAGRCVLFGDGEYRIILRDAVGNLVFDEWTTSLVSTAMQPVVMAATIADAVALLGLDDSAVNAETERAQAAEANLQSQITAEVNRATAAEGTLTTDLNNEIARAEAAEANLQSQITATGSVHYGTTLTDSTGHVRVTFATPFPTSCDCCVATAQNPGATLFSITVDSDATGFDCWIAFPSGGGLTMAGVTVFSWIAQGH